MRLERKPESAEHSLVSSNNVASYLQRVLHAIPGGHFAMPVLLKSERDREPHMAAGSRLPVVKDLLFTVSE